MNCYYHPELAATATCVSCGKAICTSCAVNVSGRIYCQQCISGGKVSQISRPSNTTAIISLILGILSLCLGGIFFSIPAWILGNMAIKQIEENPNQDGIQLAKAGKTIGMIVTILFLSFILLYILFLVGAVGISFFESIIQQ